MVELETVLTSHQVFSEAFTVFRSMKETGEHIDCSLRGETEEGEVEVEGVDCHKLVLSAVSPYFRAMFRNQESRDITIHGVDGATLECLIDYCYTGCLPLSLDTVCSVLAASDLLLLDWVSLQCQQFLIDNIHLENVLTAARLANIYRLTELEKIVVRFCESQFSQLVRTEDWLGLTEEEVTNLLTSDGLVTTEENVLQSVLAWWTAASASDLEVLERLLSCVRFSLCPPAFLESLGQEERYEAVVQSKAFRRHQDSSLPTNLLERRVRRRGTSEVMCVHHDDSDQIHHYNPDLPSWSVLTSLPPGAGVEYAALASLQSRLFLVGGRSRDGRSLRSVFSYDLSTSTWARLPDMKEVRWYHGALTVGTRLYAVAGCTQLDSLEYLDLDLDLDLDTEQGRANRANRAWQLGPAMSCPRHLPGVGRLETDIYVCGGSDDNWGAHHTVEKLDTNTNTWSRLADMLVPRIQPTVLAHNGSLYVLGGRNSNKVELMSGERFSPATNTWSMVKEMSKKRWGGGGCVLHDQLVVVGGKGKRVGQTGEVYSEETNSWSSLLGDIPAPDRSYNACVLTKPWNWPPKPS